MAVSEKLYGTLYATESLTGSIGSGGSLSGIMGIGSGGGSSKIFYGTTQFWNEKPTLIATRGGIYVYSDHSKDPDNKDIPAIKIGDGTSYLIDMPFTDDTYARHILDTVVHITQEEREFWNRKVSCHIDPTNNQNLIFTVD